MKRAGRISFLVAAVLVLCFCITACSSGSSEETTVEETTAFLADFYKLTDESRTLSIQLDADPASGYNWTYEISDESILSLTSFAFHPGDEDGNGAVWSASFAAPSTKGGSVQIALYSVENLQDVKNTEPEYVMELYVAVDGKLTVKSIKR